MVLRNLNSTSGEKGWDPLLTHTQHEAYNMIQKQIKTLIETIVQKQQSCSQLLTHRVTEQIALVDLSVHAAVTLNDAGGNWP